MSRVRYTKSLRDLERRDLMDAAGLEDRVRMIRVVYETDAEVAQAVIPKPLEATVGSEVCVSFASLTTQVTPDVTVESRVASFGVRVDYDSKPGPYLLTMPMTSERGVLIGRERFGQPAKLADVSLEVRSDVVEASAARKGISFLSVRGERKEAVGPREVTEHGYSFKAYPGCTPGKIFDQDPSLVRLAWHYDFANVWRLEGELKLADSAFDPVSDLPIRRLIEFEYAEGSVQSTARVLRPVPGDWLRPFIHQRYDEPDVDGVDV